jgi:hypothetical protein
MSEEKPREFWFELNGNEYGQLGDKPPRYPFLKGSEIIHVREVTDQPDEKVARIKELEHQLNHAYEKLDLALDKNPGALNSLKLRAKKYAKSCRPISIDMGKWCGSAEYGRAYKHFLNGARCTYAWLKQKQTEAQGIEIKESP